MPSAKKSNERTPRKATDDDSDFEEEEQEEEVESMHTKKKREKGRKAFAKMVRWLLSFIPLTMVLAQQPFMEKPRQPGVNRVKLIPLQLAITGGVHWAQTSPTTMRNPKLAVYLNTTAQVLLTPHEYFRTRSRKTATDREKTWAKAYDKAGKQLARVAEGDATLRSIVAMPMPNIPLIGAYVLLVGVLLAPLVGGMEYLVVGGCLLVLQGTRSFGMEPQPDLYVTGAIAVIALFALDMANKKLSNDPKRKRR
jgi:hypothetical protein